MRLPLIVTAVACVLATGSVGSAAAAARDAAGNAAGSAVPTCGEPTRGRWKGPFCDGSPRVAER